MTKPLNFTVVCRSSNTNSFGLRGFVLLARSGLAYEVGRSDYNGETPWKVGQTVEALGVLNESGDAVESVQFPGCELPRQLPSPSPARVRKFLTEVKAKISA